ncbi:MULTISPECIES: hypothetical protein [Streptomyces]
MIFTTRTPRLFKDGKRMMALSKEELQKVVKQRNVTLSLIKKL